MREQRNVYKVTKFICGKYNGCRNAPYNINKDSSSPLRNTIWDRRKIPDD